MQQVRKWSTHPEANRLVLGILQNGLEESQDAKAFAKLIHQKAAIRLADILDHICFCDDALICQLEAHGWSQVEPQVWKNKLGRFPDFVKQTDSGKRLDGPVRVYFRVEDIDHFVAVTGCATTIEGRVFGPFRRALAFRSKSVEFWALERSGHVGYDMPDVDAALARSARIHLQAFKARRRQFSSKKDGFDYTENLVDAAVHELGTHWACHLFFKAERQYWMTRCAAGRRQTERQNNIGLGWVNVDHDTYDSSRQWFHRTIRILEKLGYECRELFYAGHQAGWGSQVLEQPVLGTTIFADIDLAPEELDIDFAHMELEPLPKYRRAGVWAKMHGESMLEAGLNHVAGLYDYKKMRTILHHDNIQIMEPFSDLPYLYQELTLGEWIAVDPVKVDWLEQQGHITAKEAEDFRLRGALATHLENIERNDGYKGFNQDGIDGVLRIIDPRKNLDTASAAE